MHDAYLLTGGNMGDRLYYLTKAKQFIQEYCGDVRKASAIYETAAWGQEDQAPFLNQVLMVHIKLDPFQLLKTILQIEESLGRKRAARYGPRYIDIDILFYNDTVMDEPGLTIPHPQMQHRRFVLIPLAQVAGTKKHPVFDKTVSQLLDECSDDLTVNKFY